MPVVPLPHAFLTTPIAHRGYHAQGAARPENSRGAFRAAVDAGYGIELDVQRSSDGQAMVFHDDDLDRLTKATGPIGRCSAADLARIALCDGDGETIPTLSEVLAIVAGRVPLLIEIKENLGTMANTEGRLEAAVADALRDYTGPVAVMSFNPNCIAHMARLAPDVPRGLTTESYVPEKSLPIPPAICDRLREIPDYGRTEASFISHEATDLDRPRVADLKAAGASVLCWTIRSPSAEQAARKTADNITFEGYAPVLALDTTIPG